MVLRFLLRLLGNNEQLINRLSESYPIRRAAQFVVYLFNRGKAISQDPNITKKLEDVNPQAIKSFSDKWTKNLSETLKSVKENLEKQSRK